MRWTYWMVRSSYCYLPDLFSVMVWGLNSASTHCELDTCVCPRPLLTWPSSVPIHLLPPASPPPVLGPLFSLPLCRADSGPFPR